MGFEAKNCYICLKKHPFVSCILLFYFLVYMFLPSVFNVLIYTTPLIVIAAVLRRFFFSIDSKSIKDVKGKDNRNDGLYNGDLSFVQDDHIIDKCQSYSTHIHKARQRNVKEKNKEDYAAEDKNTISSTSFNDDNPKEIREVEVDYVIGKDEIERGSSRYEEEAKRTRDKVAEWTKADQKKPMDLGIFEVERTRRLESLIARRRARKLLSLQVRKTPMKVGGNEPHGQITSIYIPKGNPFLSNNSSTQVLTPGSAPSRLVPMHNPFDLPYDPYEEKPNLTGDSFQQEFMAAQQKEMMYCRHESFNWGGFLPQGCKQDRHETFFYHGFATRPRSQNNKFGHPLGEAMFNGGRARDHAEDIYEAQTKQNLVEDFNGGSSSSFSSEANSFTFSDPKSIAADMEDYGQTNNLLYDSRPSFFEKTSAEERLFYTNKEMNHTPTNSIASDMQVEVSESGSPLLTIDGNSSSSDEESSINDGDMDKEIVSGSEEMFSVSSNLSGLDKTESRLREVSISSNLSGMDRDESRSRDVHGINEQDSIEKSSLSPSKTGLSERIQAPKKMFNVEVHDKEPFYPSARSIHESNSISRVLKSVAVDTEEGSQGQISPRAVVAPSESAIVANSRSIEETEGKSEKVIEVEPTVGSSQDLEEESKLKNIKDT